MVNAVNTQKEFIARPDGHGGGGVSIEAANWAWRTRLPHSDAKLTLVYLADICFPRNGYRAQVYMGQICKATSISREETRRALRQLSARRLIRREFDPDPDAPTVYTLNVRGAA